jgi:hypothetical protein
MPASIAFNPFLTSVASGSFNATSSGFIVGQTMADPAARYQLASGFLAQTETLPMWGGVAINEGFSPGTTSTSTTGSSLGSPITRAALLGSAGVVGSITGFCVFDQNFSAITTPQSPVPLVASGGTFNYLRLGSKGRVALQVNPLVIAAAPIASGNISWDFVNQQITTFQPAYAANVTTAAAWAGGVATLTTTTPHGVLVGTYVVLAGFTPAAWNGVWLAVAGTTGSTLVLTMPVNPGAVTVEGALSAGGGALPVTILDYDVGNSMTVSYNPSTGFATYNRSGSAMLVLL